MKKHTDYCKKINGIKLAIDLCEEVTHFYYITPMYLDGEIIDHACNSDEHFCETFKQAVSAIIDTLENELKDDFDYSISQNESLGITDVESFMARERMLSLNSKIFEVTIIPKKKYELFNQRFSQLGIYTPAGNALK